MVNIRQLRLGRKRVFKNAQGIQKEKYENVLKPSVN